MNYARLFDFIYFYWLVRIKQFVVVFGKCPAEVLGSVVRVSRRLGEKR